MCALYPMHMLYRKHLFCVYNLVSHDKLRLHCMWPTCGSGQYNVGKYTDSPGWQQPECSLIMIINIIELGLWSWKVSPLWVSKHTVLRFSWYNSHTFNSEPSQFSFVYLAYSMWPLVMMIKTRGCLMTGSKLGLKQHKDKRPLDPRGAGRLPLGEKCRATFFWNCFEHEWRHIRQLWAATCCCVCGVEVHDS